MARHRRQRDSAERRAKAGPRRSTTVLSEPAPGPTPPCPVKDAHEETQRWWEQIHASPVSSLWDDADCLALHRLAWAADEWHRGRESRTVLSEIARLERQLLLTPLARRNAGVEIETEPEEPERHGPTADELAAARAARAREAERRLRQYESRGR